MFIHIKVQDLNKTLKKGNEVEIYSFKMSFKLLTSVVCIIYSSTMRNNLVWCGL